MTTENIQPSELSIKGYRKHPPPKNNTDKLTIKQIKERSDSINYHQGDIKYYLM